MYSIIIYHSGQAKSGQILNPEIEINADDAFMYREFETRFAWLRFVAGYKGHGMRELRRASRTVLQYH
jgi:hypothetical protein